MDWNNILDNTAVLWGALGFAGLNTALNLVKMLGGVLNGKGLKKLLSFTAIADKNVKSSELNFKSIKTEIVKAIKEEIVAPLVAELQSEREDKTLLANIAVTALSVSNVPLAEKKALFNVLNKISLVSSEATKLLEANIKVAEEKNLIVEKEDNDLEESINNS